MNIDQLESYNLGDAVKFNDRLNPKLWSPDEHLKPEVHSKLLEIAEDFREFLGITDLQLKDITISGSNAAYTYTPHSDIDLHLVVDLPEADASEVYRELFDAKKYQYNNQHNITIGGYDVELYVQDANRPHHSQGIYSVLRNDWIDVPKRRKTNIDDVSARSKYKDLEQRIDQAVASADYDVMSALSTKIRELRQSGLDQHGEFGPENLAFKMLRSQGKIKQLYDARNRAKDQLLSLDERRKKKKKKVRYGYGAYWYPGTGYAGQDHAAGSEGGGDGGGGESLRESVDLSDEEILKDFVEFCVKELKIKHMPRVKLRKDPQWSVVNRTFGRYINDVNTLEVAFGQRHIMDVLRTVAHELTHQHQHERADVPVDAGETGSPYENEANARAGVLMRDYGRLHPELFDASKTEDLKEAIDQELSDNDKLYLRILDNIKYRSKDFLTARGASGGQSFTPSILAYLKQLQQLGKENVVKFIQQSIAQANQEDRQTKGMSYGVLAQALVHLADQEKDKTLANARREYNKQKQSIQRGVEESASGYIPTKAQAKDPRYSMALTQDIKPGQVGKEANKLKLRTDKQGHPQIARADGLFETLMAEYKGLDEANIPATTGKFVSPTGSTSSFKAGYDLGVKVVQTPTIAPVSRPDIARTESQKYPQPQEFVAGFKRGTSDVMAYSRNQQQAQQDATRVSKFAKFKSVTPDQIAQIVQRYSNGEGGPEIAPDFGLNAQQIIRILDKQPNRDEIVKLNRQRRLGQKQPQQSLDLDQENLTELALKSTLPVTQTMNHPGKQVYDMKTQSGEYRIVFGISNKDDNFDNDPDYDGPTGYLLDVLLLGQDPKGSWTQYNTNVGEKQVAQIFATIAQLAVKIIKAQPGIDEIEIKGADPQRSRIYSRLMQQNIDSLLPGWKLGGAGLVREKPQQAVAEVIKMPPVNMVFSNENLVDWAYNDAQKKQARQLQSLKTDVPTRVYDMGDHVRVFVIDDQGPVLYLALEKFLDGFKTNAVQIRPRGQGKNLAFKVYQAVSDTFQRPLYSDQTHTDASRLGIWKKLIDKFPNRLVGYDQATREDLPLTATDQGPVVRGKEPIYVQKKKKDLAKPVTPQTRSRTRLLKFLPATAKQVVAEDQQISWKMPNFDREYDEVEWQLEHGRGRIPQDVLDFYAKYFPTKQAWLKAVRNGRAVEIPVQFGREIRNNTENKKEWLHALSAQSHDPEGPAKKARVDKLFASGGPIEMPIILNTSQGLWLIGGKTRLGKARLELGIPAKVWMISGRQAVTEDQQLDEVKMSPSALQSWAKSPAAQGIRAGFEAELIFRDTTNDDDDDDEMEPDYDYDERPRSISDVIDFFNGGDYGGLSDRQEGRLQDGLDEQYMEWQDERMRDAFDEEVEDLIRKVLVDEGDWDLDNEIQKQLELLDLSDDEMNAIINAGERAPRFTKSSEQQAYIQENPLYKKYLDAQTEAEGLLDDLVADEVRKQGANYDAALDDFRENFYVDDDSSFFQDVGLSYMSDIASEYSLDWPYLTGSGGGNNGGNRDWNDIGSSLEKTVGMPVKVSSGYHNATRREGQWIVEPDTSLSPDDREDYGLEIVSPPMPLLTALEQLQAVTDWANSDAGNAYTNSSTGLHMGVSVPYKGGDVDYVKLILFLGDEYVLQSFGREANSYTKSAMAKFRENIKGGRADPAGALMLMKNNLIEFAYREIQKGVGTGKYTSAHIQDGYIEFRSAGGDWLAEESADPQKLSSTMLRYARAMQIAANPAEERQEYAKKLYKLVAPEGDSQLALFSQFAAGAIDKDELKKQWAEKTIGTERKMNQRWKLYDRATGEPVAGQEYNGYTEEEARARAKGKISPGSSDRDFDSAYELRNIGQEQQWEIYSVDTGKTLEIVKGRNKGEAADAVFDKYAAQKIGFNVRPYQDPATMTPRAKLAKRIASQPGKTLDYNYEIVNQADVRLPVVDKFYATNETDAQKVYSQWLKSKNLPDDTENYGYRKVAAKPAENPPWVAQNFDSARDSATLQTNLQGRAGQDATEIPRNWEFVNRRSGNVVDTLSNASYQQADAMQAEVERRHPNADIYLRSVERPTSSAQTVNRSWGNLDQYNWDITNRDTGDTLYRINSATRQSAAEYALNWLRNQGLNSSDYQIVIAGTS